MLGRSHKASCLGIAPFRDVMRFVATTAERFKIRGVVVSFVFVPVVEL